MRTLYPTLVWLGLCALGAGCSDSGDSTPALPAPPPAAECPPDTPERRYLAFWGRCWEVRRETEPQAPGLNLYSSDERDAWVDETGRLHLRVSRRDGKWFCTELFTRGVGYGTYVFRVRGQVDRMDPNLVLGFFTWDPLLFETGAWNEIDIELARWGGSLWNLQYAVQPLYGPDSPKGRYDERRNRFFVALPEPRSTHVFVWMPDGVRFETYEGFGRDPAQLLASWDFPAGAPARRANATDLAVPVGIPPAVPSMELRIDFWLNDSDKDGMGDPPRDGLDAEVVIESFDFIPAEI